MKQQFLFIWILFVGTACRNVPPPSKPLSITPPRSLHKTLKSQETKSKMTPKILDEVSSWDQYGHLRLQIHLEVSATNPTQKELRQTVFAQLSPYFKTYSVIWADVFTPNSKHPVAKLDWFAPDVLAHQKYSVIHAHETYKGLNLAYFKH